MPDVDFGIDPLPNLPDRVQALERLGRPGVPRRYSRGVGWVALGYDNIAEVWRTTP